MITVLIISIYLIGGVVNYSIMKRWAKSETWTVGKRAKSITFSLLSWVAVLICIGVSLDYIWDSDKPAKW
jgi:hypothetical protein